MKVGQEGRSGTQGLQVHNKESVEKVGIKGDRAAITFCQF